MARKSQFAKEIKKQKLVEKYAELRAQLKEKGDYEALQKLPRDSSKTRLRNRCQFTGRARGNYRKFGISRLVFREMCLRGEIPGIKKASW
ncbi:MAG TPA: 30S ribosomal protein S14 [Ignavibacteriales bacterium]|nr:30S ribosomal protein S14 [Ignavibacteriales bacterium]HOL80167.1 30S ribosomal protein S14 [Ignavibacteriales bacterium]HOM64449.1 30S ribosomal protein S14 [Ignavibacteriales bacterium]HPD67936.1 30S ribosomal protein S14 [Ignavibacteriales bacterium]HPP32356.1 30S ribosomal protein S14 [Ignavibacteriales bacterium]